MRICDKCRGDASMIVTTSDGQVFDLCREHYEDFIKWLGEHPAEESKDQPIPASTSRRGRPRKEVTQ